MTTPISNQDPQNPIAAARRNQWILQRVERLGLELSQHPQLTDHLSNDLKDWHTRFLSDLRSHSNPAHVEREYIDLLITDIFIDPISHSILEERSWLGSDGNTYGNMTLTLYYSSVGEENRFRSPLSTAPLEGQDLTFTVRQHPLVPIVFSWLQERGVNLRNEQTETLYQQLMREAQFPPQLPTDQLLRAHRLRESQRREGESHSSHVSHYQQDLVARGRDLAANREANVTQFNDQVTSVRNTVNTAIQNVQQEVQGAFALIARKREQLQGEIGQLNREIAALRNELSYTRSEIHQGKREDAQIQANVKEVKKAVKKRKKNQLKQIGTSLAIIGGCALATWGVWALAGVGSAAIAPATGGIGAVASTQINMYS